MNVSIIIPAYNNEATIRDVLASLKNQKYTQGKYEIIIIDDHSTDNTVKICKDLGFTVFCNEINQGLGFSLNKGIKQASYEIIATVHGDTVPKTDSWLETLVQPLSDEKNAASCSFQEPPNLQDAEVSIWEKLLWSKQEPHCALNNKADAYRKKTLIEIGLFDNHTFRYAGEDEDISLRIKKAGYEIIETAAPVIHNHKFNGNNNQKLKGILSKEYTFGRAGGALRRKKPTYYPGSYIFPVTKGPFFDGLLRFCVCLGMLIPRVSLFILSVIAIMSLNGIIVTTRKTGNILIILLYPFFNIFRYYIYSFGYLHGLLSGKQG